MRAVIQRVLYSSVEVDGDIAGKIEDGLLVYLGVNENDDLTDAKYIADKICNLRIFNDADCKMNLSVKEVEGEILLISQFTLHGDCRKGRRPSFSSTGDPKKAHKLYNETIEMIKINEIPIQTGIFGANMKIISVNDGPVTMLLDSSKLF